MRKGPTIEALTRRLTECPPPFLMTPRMGRMGDIHVGAVVHDLLRAHGYVTRRGDLDSFRNINAQQQNWLQLVLVACWLAHDPALRAIDGLASPMLRWLTTGVREVSKMVAAPQFVNNPDRREELARLLMQATGLLPEDETEEQFLDRLSTVDTIERAHIMAETRAKRERAEQLRKQMAEERARQAAAKYSRE